MAEIVVSDSANGDTVVVHVGDTVKLALMENPTTGYRWREVSSDPTILRSDLDEFVTGSDAVGAGGKHHFSYIAIAKGTATVTLACEREWLKQSRQSKLLTLFIRVV